MKKIIITLMVLSMSLSLFAAGRIGGGLGARLAWAEYAESTQEFAAIVDGANYLTSKEFFNIAYSIGVGYDLLLANDFKSIIPEVKPAILLQLMFNVNDQLYTETGIGAYAGFGFKEGASTEFGAKIDMDLGYRLFDNVDLKVGFDMEVPFYKMAKDNSDWHKGFSVSPTLGIAYIY